MLQAAKLLSATERIALSDAAATAEPVAAGGKRGKKQGKDH
jgi:hypothetical protein